MYVALLGMAAMVLALPTWQLYLTLRAVTGKHLFPKSLLNTFEHCNNLFVLVKWEHAI